MKNIIVVTGGAGFVGSNLIEYLLIKTNYRIISLDNYSTGTKKNHIFSKRVKYLNGNTLERFPDESLQDHLQFLGVARCCLTSLPSYLSQFKRLVYLDARDNNITSVDASFKSLITSNDMESYFSGNMVCKDDNSLDCEPLCSKTCWRRTAPNDGVCDVECNTPP